MGENKLKESNLQQHLQIVEQLCPLLTAFIWFCRLMKAVSQEQSFVNLQVMLGI